MFFYRDPGRFVKDKKQDGRKTPQGKSWKSD
jgi:hypothetical protein